MTPSYTQRSGTLGTSAETEAGREEEKGDCSSLVLSLMQGKKTSSALIGTCVCSPWNNLGSPTVLGGQRQVVYIACRTVEVLLCA